MSFTHLATIPILRAYDEAKTREFYLDWLGFRVDFEHRFEPGMPLYMGISRGGAQLHISEHHGDGVPGIRVRINIRGVRDLHAELSAKRYAYNRPGLEHPDWGFVELTVIDPCNNRITFAEPDQA